GEFPFTPDNCDTGMPEFLGYTLIGTVANRDGSNQPITTFIDNGLNVGAQYCYRLVAIFGQPKGGESLVSDEICIEPIEADVPIITHVTVEKTGTTDGEIRVSWKSPLNINKTQYPGPYKYVVTRAIGFANDNPRQRAHPGLISDTTFVDTGDGDTGLDTETEIYNYRVSLWSNTSADLITYSKIDSSSLASAVRLEAQSQLKKINLTWSAFTPWSNLDPFNPRHLVYRGLEGQPLSLIDSINVTQAGLNYVDSGQYNNVPLENEQVYCYQVVTRGTYGNPAIHDPTNPLENSSQIICAQPSDTIPPCKPLPPVADLPNCDTLSIDYLCSNNVFENRITWAKPDEDSCRSQISYYRIYAAITDNGKYNLIDSVRDNFYIHKSLPSNAQCYRISVVDRSGNESELSDPVCIDNCWYFEMPNVFTPNNDGCNDFFSAYSDSTRYTMASESGFIEQCGNGIREEDKTRCARFVRNVSFKVFNRWGKEVFDYKSGGENTIYVDWNGRDNNGQDLASAIYYWVAEVEFETVQADRVKTYKGWVHLLR
ncbi:MAG: gliding motility-associated C-terminal domain-containing protein, partial [Flammeovirgaceae bacterium]|nr:gliding motility-associated C-terminal domain-containing protein [Flammeovirgaceae bacterium]